MNKCFLIISYLIVFVTIGNSQKKIYFGIGGGIVFNKTVNAKKANPLSYDVNSYINVNLFAHVSCILNSRNEFYSKIGYISTGFKERKFQGFEPMTTFPLIHINTHKFDYVETTIGWSYFISENLSLALGMKYLFFLKDLEDTAFFEREVFEINGFRTRPKLKYEFETKNFHEFDIGIEVGVFYFFWKRLYVHPYYYRGFNHLNPISASAGNSKMFNQSFVLTIGYQFPVFGVH